MNCALLFKKIHLLNLKNLIILLAFFVALITLLNGFYANHQVQKNQLIKHTLDTNHAYAQKLAAATNNFLDAAHQQLAFTANLIKKDLGNQALLTDEAERLHLQTSSFNSIAIVNNKGVVLAVSPNTLGILAYTVKSMDSPNTHTNLTKIKSWYFESSELKRAMLKGLELMNVQINQLKEEAATDPLTGALNRRS